MKKPDSEVVQNTRRLMINQAVIGLILVGIFWFSRGELAAVSALFGTFSALSIAAVLGYGVIRANKIATTNPQRSMIIIYFGAVQRFVLVLALFILGLAVLELDPLAMAATFGLTQIAYAINLRHQTKV